MLVVLDRSKHQVSIVNAGHMAPLLRQASGHVEEIGEDEAGFPLGIDAETVYRQSCRPLAPGESLTMYTDGISEAMNDAGELYGIQRLREQLAGQQAQVSGVGRVVLDDVRRFVGGRAQNDDMCLVSFGRL